MADGVAANERLCSRLFLSNSILVAKEFFMKIVIAIKSLAHNKKAKTFKKKVRIDSTVKL